MHLKVGELARRSGLTIRTLHHYDAIGLLKPSARADNGYRLYDQRDVARLHRIQALRRFGLSLTEIGTCLARPDIPLTAIVEQQIAMLDRQIAQACTLRERLAQLRGVLDKGEEPDLADWLTILELMTMYDRYFSPEELARLPMYHKSRSPDPEWTGIVAEAQALLDSAVPPESERAGKLATRWMTMLVRDTNGDPRLLAKLNLMHDKEPAVQSSMGISVPLRNYVLSAFSETKMRIYERYLSAEEARFMRANYGKGAMEWPELMADARDAIDDGADPASERGQTLARRWLDLFRGYAGNSPATHAKFRTALMNEPELLAGTWADEALLEFMRNAMTHLQTNASPARN